MKLFRMFLVSLTLSLIFAGAALAKADVTELYAEALMTGDVESLDKLLAPNYWHVSANGHIQDKEHFLASLKERKLVIDRIRLSNMRSTVMGDVTLVTANGELKGSATPSQLAALWAKPCSSTTGAALAASAAPHPQTAKR